MKYRQFNFRVDEELYEWIRTKAFKHRRKMSDMVRTILQVEMQIDMSEKLPEWWNKELPTPIFTDESKNK